MMNLKISRLLKRMRSNVSNSNFSPNSSRPNSVLSKSTVQVPSKDRQKRMPHLLRKRISRTILQSKTIRSSQEGELQPPTASTGEAPKGIQATGSAIPRPFLKETQNKMMRLRRTCLESRSNQGLNRSLSRTLSLSRADRVTVATCPLLLKRRKIMQPIQGQLTRL